MTLSKLDFMTLLLQEMKRNKENSFNKIVLEGDFFYYKTNKKYSSLFREIPNKTNNMLDLSKSIEYLNTLNCVIRNKYIPYEFKISPNINNLCLPIDTKSNDLMKKLVEEYLAKEKISKKSPIKLKIYSINPNNYYSIVRGTSKYETEVEWRLITDSKANIEIGSLTTSGVLNFCRDSVNFYNLLRLRDSTSLELQVKQADFAIMQGFDNKKLKSAIIYTETLDNNYLEQLVDTATSTDREINPNIKVLTLSNHNSF